MKLHPLATIDLDAWDELRKELPEGARPVELASVQGRFVGVLARRDLGSKQALSVWVHPQERGRGVGDEITELATGRAHYLACRLSDKSYFCERGFRVEDTEDDFCLLQPPTLRDDLLLAGSVCLFHRESQSVLLGRRKTRSWFGYWAFPGGGLEEGESLQECALRELYEETSIKAQGQVLRSSRVYVGTEDGEKVYAVTNFVVEIGARHEATDSSELHSEWFTLEQARALRPMAAGTRRVLRGF